MLAAFLAGAIGVFAFAPFHAWPIAPLSMAILFALWHHANSAKHAAAIGLVWGLGLFLAGASWLYVAIHVYGEMPAPLAAFAIFLFCCYLAIFPMLAGLAVHKLCRSHQPVLALLLIMPACFVANEYVRGWFFSGFPWLISGYSQTPGGWILAPLAGFAPMVGVFGISWLLALTAGALLLLLPPLSGMAVSKRGVSILSVAILWVWGAGAALLQISWGAPSGAPLSVALVQGNIGQDLKWRDDQREITRAKYFNLVKDIDAKLIVLPETAEVTLLQDIPTDYLTALQSRAKKNGGDLIMGVPIAERDGQSGNLLRYTNSAISLGVSAPQRYDKHHLVAFGEFIPPLFSWVYQWLNIPLGTFTPGAETQAPMRVSGHFIPVNICYEDAFGSEIARALPAAELLINIGNMAWYGRSLAADQQVQFSQMRAMETSRWMLRSTNTGLTAAINERGEIVKSLPQFTAGVLAIEATPRQGVTPYMRWRDAPVLMGLAMALLAAAWLSRSQKTS